MDSPNLPPDAQSDDPVASVAQANSPSPPFGGMFRAVPATRSYEEVVRQVEEAIRSGKIERGQRLPTERQLSETFDVSRGVIREAVKVLEAMGLVEARQGSGIYVRNDTIPSVTKAFILSVSPDAESVDRLFEFRRGLEAEAARLAAIRHADEHIATMAEALLVMERAVDPLNWAVFGTNDSLFHNTLARASGNPYLEVAIAAARDMQRDVMTLFAKHAGSIHTAIAQHRDVFDAVRAGDSDLAGRLMADHIAYTSSSVQAVIARQDRERDESPVGREQEQP